MTDAQFAALMACISAQTVSVVAMLAIVFNRIGRFKGPMVEFEMDEARAKPKTSRKNSSKKACSGVCRTGCGKRKAARKKR